ncbi:MAG TPA: hypothetical protein VGD98_25955 [Ktedonobacteraceae bacterium]
MLRNNNAAIHRIAERWSRAFPAAQTDPESRAHTSDAATQALSALRVIAQDALARGRDVLLLRIW